MTDDVSDILVRIMAHQADYIESLLREVELLQAEVFTLRVKP